VPSGRPGGRTRNPIREVPLTRVALEALEAIPATLGSQFDVTTGAVLRGPATELLATYEVREKNGEIQIRL
jgi:nitrite reductase/ring-hydroxylating ferredoxin subunit